MTLLLTHRWLSLLLCSLWAVPTLANIDLPETQRWSIFYRAALEQQSTPLVASQTSINTRLRYSAVTVNILILLNIPGKTSQI